MTPLFLAAVKYVLANEGGHANVKGDRGGETMLGISRKAYPGESLAELTVERAMELYHRDYWSRINLDTLTNESLVTKLFDLGVWMGPHTAVSILQTALCELGQRVEVDGALGPDTRRAIHDVVSRYSTEHLLAMVSGLAFERVRGIVQRDETQRKFLAGWSKRALAVPV